MLVTNHNLLFASDTHLIKLQTTSDSGIYIADQQFGGVADSSPLYSAGLTAELKMRRRGAQTC